MKANELKNISFPECYKNCELVLILGVSECENIKCCKHKFKQTNGEYNNG